MTYMTSSHGGEEHIAPPVVPSLSLPVLPDIRHRQTQPDTDGLLRSLFAVYNCNLADRL